jgi:hypothetical protein
MTVPISPHDHIRLLASYGWGHEDICVRLKITGPARVRVRALVLGIDDDQMHPVRAGLCGRAIVAAAQRGGS